MVRRFPDRIQRETTRHGKTVYYFRRGSGKPRVRMPDDLNSDEFAAFYEHLLRDYPQAVAKRAALDDRRRRNLERAIRQKVKHARIRDGHKRAISSDITTGWAVQKLRAQEYRCAVTGLAFHISLTKSGRLQPFAPSLDRIDNAKGYEIGNVQIVVLAYNMMRLDWPSDVFETVIQGYLENKNSRTSNPELPHHFLHQTKSNS